MPLINNEIQSHSAAATAIFHRADTEGRGLTEAERRKVQDHLSKAQAAQRVAELGWSLGAPDRSRPHGLDIGGRPGETFTKSEGYRRIADPTTRGSSWTTGAVEISTKATLYEGDIDSPGEGAALVQPDVRPGILPTLFQPLRVADLIRTSTTDSNKVRVIVESVADNGAESVDEGGTKPDSSLVFDETDEPVRKVATFLGPVSDELLSDAPSLSAYLNSRLSLFVQIEEENQLLNGDGEAPNLSGLLDRVPVGNQDIVSDAEAPNSADHIYAAIIKVQESYLDADAVVVNPADWGDLRLLKDQNENYVAGSPFSNGQPQPGELIFGRRVVVTEAIAAGTALVGAFGTATEIFRRGGLTVEMSNSHDTWFASDEVAIRAEARLALAVHRPAALATAQLNPS
jgi:HK97 family phage major capsid protein